MYPMSRELVQGYGQRVVYDSLKREATLEHNIRILGIDRLRVDQRTRKVIELDFVVVNEGRGQVRLEEFSLVDLVMCYMLDDGSRHCKWVPHLSIASIKPYWEVVDSGFESATRSGLSYVLGGELINPETPSDDSPKPRGVWDPKELIVVRVYFDRRDPYAPYYNYDTRRRGLLIGGFFTIIYALPNGVLAMHNTFTDIGEVVIEDD